MDVYHRELLEMMKNSEVSKEGLGPDDASFRLVDTDDVHPAGVIGDGGHGAGVAPGEGGLQAPGEDGPDVEAALPPAPRHVVPSGAEAHPAPVTAHVIARPAEVHEDAPAPDVHHLDLVVPGADGQLVEVPRDVQARHLPAHHQLLHRLGGGAPGVPQPDLLVEMSAENDLVCRHDVVTARACKLCANAGLAPQVPDLQCPVVTAAHHSGGVAQELGGQHLS